MRLNTFQANSLRSVADNLEDGQLAEARQELQSVGMLTLNDVELVGLVQDVASLVDWLLDETLSDDEVRQEVADTVRDLRRAVEGS